ncbi:unnamed protein product [Gadus morhua 'NCC']
MPEEVAVPRETGRHGTTNLLVKTSPPRECDVTPGCCGRGDGAFIIHLVPLSLALLMCCKGVCTRVAALLTRVQLEAPRRQAVPWDQDQLGAIFFLSIITSVGGHLLPQYQLGVIFFLSIITSVGGHLPHQDQSGAIFLTNVVLPPPYITLTRCTLRSVPALPLPDDTSTVPPAQPRMKRSAVGRPGESTPVSLPSITPSPWVPEREGEVVHRRALRAAAVKVVSISQAPLKCVAQGRLVFLVFRRVVAQTAAGHFLLLTCPARLQEEGGGSFEGLDEHQEDPG